MGYIQLRHFSMTQKTLESALARLSSGFFRFVLFSPSSSQTAPRSAFLFYVFYLFFPDFPRCICCTDLLLMVVSSKAAAAAAAATSFIWWFPAHSAHGECVL